MSKQAWEDIDRQQAEYERQEVWASDFAEWLSTDSIAEHIACQITETLGLPAQEATVKEILLAFREKGVLRFGGSGNATK